MMRAHGSSAQPQQLAHRAGQVAFRTERGEVFRQHPRLAGIKPQREVAMGELVGGFALHPSPIHTGGGGMGRVCTKMPHVNDAAATDVWNPYDMGEMRDIST